MTDMDIKEIALVEDIAALGKIYTDCRASANEIHRNGSWDAVDVAKANALRALNLASRYAAEQILQKIRNHAADLNQEGTKNDNT